MEGLPSPVSVKVHARVCSELLNLVGTVSEIIPEIEAARPRASGMEALGLLHNGISEAMSLLQRCSESSVLYLAFTGEDFLSRCKKSRNLLDQCLSQIQSMVPVILAEKISGVNLALRRAAFCLDPSEEKARKVLRELLHQYGSTVDSTEDFALSAIHAVCSLLHISSHRALLIEKRSIKKQLDRVGEASQIKRKILKLFLRLVDRYMKFTTEDRKHGGCEVEPQANCSYDGAQTNMLNWCVTLPSELMHDPPVFIASAQTDEDSTNSFASLASAMNNLNLPSDSSYTSLGSSQCSDYPCSNTVDVGNEVSAHPLNSRCTTVENIRRLLKISDASLSMMPLGKLIGLLIRYLKDARDCHDIVAQMTGCRYLLEHVQRHGNSVSYLKEDAYCLLTSLLDTQATMEVLSILEVLSSHQQCHHRIAESSALADILIILEHQVEELLEPALNILSNLSTNRDICSFITPSDFIPKLLPLFETRKLARYCVTILKNLCDNGENIASCIAETDGCVASIAKLLESGNHVEQECALSILVSLCSEGAGYCHLIMDDGVISGLFDVSINGNEKVKAMALRLIQILEAKYNRDV
ncbi:hypothetical protein C2S51_014831 [Perilla frutescens var. frutescens]|nr:hypothetical protein C2S51_014831 [Perilla frutescens var. frutescens]